MELTLAGQVEARTDADRIRDELLATLQELERRRARLVHVGDWLRAPAGRQHAVTWTLLAGAAAAGMAWWQLEPGRRRFFARSASVLPPWGGPVLRHALAAGLRAWIRGRTRLGSRGVLSAGAHAGAEFHVSRA